MEANFKQDHITDKAERYKTFLRQFAPLIEGETHEISVLANTCAALKEAFGFFWVGFYLAENDELVLGPQERTGRVRNRLGTDADIGCARRGTIPRTHCLQFPFTLRDSGAYPCRE